MPSVTHGRSGPRTGRGILRKAGHAEIAKTDTIITTLLHAGNACETLPRHTLNSYKTTGNRERSGNNETENKQIHHKDIHHILPRNIQYSRAYSQNFNHPCSPLFTCRKNVAVHRWKHYKPQRPTHNPPHILSRPLEPRLFRTAKILNNTSVLK